MIYTYHVFGVDLAPLTFSNRYKFYAAAYHRECLIALFPCVPSLRIGAPARGAGAVGIGPIGAFERFRQCLFTRARIQNIYDNIVVPRTNKWITDISVSRIY